MRLWGGTPHSCLLCGSDSVELNAPLDTIIRGFIVSAPPPPSPLPVSLEYSLLSREVGGAATPFYNSLFALHKFVSLKTSNKHAFVLLWRRKTFDVIQWLKIMIFSHSFTDVRSQSTALTFYVLRSKRVRVLCTADHWKWPISRFIESISLDPLRTIKLNSGRNPKLHRRLFSSFF